MSEQTSHISKLIQGCIKGSPSAQKELVTQYAAMLMAVSRRYTQTRETAEDVLQESFILIFKNIGQYNAERGSFQGWMRRIIIHTALSIYRKKSYNQESSYELPPETEDMQADVFSMMNFESLLELIEKLPDGAREVFNLFVFDDFSHEEIAQELGIAAGTSRSLLSRARKMLQTQILNLKAHELAGI